jgi:hypothetical protein
MIRGVTYETVREAAEAFGLGTSYIYDAIERGRQDMIGIGRGKLRHGQPDGQPTDWVSNAITIHGLTFPSMTVASLALGFNKAYLRAALRRGSDYSKERIKFAALRYAARMEMEPLCRSK